MAKWNFSDSFITGIRIFLVWMSDGKMMNIKMAKQQLHVYAAHVQGNKHRNKTEFLRKKNSYNSFLISLPAVSIESNWICVWRRGFCKLSSTLSNYHFRIAITIRLECDNNVKNGFHYYNTCSIVILAKQNILLKTKWLYFIPSIDNVGCQRYKRKPANIDEETLK